MELSTLDGLTRLLQASISPVAMISGVGLLILSQTNRFGRITDRLRELAHQRRDLPAPDRRVETQITIFRRRARLLRGAISSAVACVLLASVQILVLFAIAISRLQLHHLALFLFAMSLVGLITSLILFLRDMHLALTAIEAELET